MNRKEGLMYKSELDQGELERYVDPTPRRKGVSEDPIADLFKLFMFQLRKREVQLVLGAPKARIK